MAKISKYIILGRNVRKQITMTIRPTCITPKQPETHGCILSTLATDVLVLKHQTSIHRANKLSTVPYQCIPKYYIDSEQSMRKQGKSEGFESCDRPIVRKRPIRVKSGDVLSRVTLKFDGWLWKTIGHLSFAVSSFVQHFITISEFKLELLSRNAQFR